LEMKIVKASGKIVASFVRDPSTTTNDRLWTKLKFQMTFLHVQSRSLVGMCAVLLISSLFIISFRSLSSIRSNANHFMEI
jgi:hypothetical protein